MKRETASAVDSRMAKALAHPLRVQLLAALNAGVASPNELAKKLDEPLTNVSYHVRMLHDLGCIELVDTEPRRGALEHYYRAIVRPFFGDRDWKRLPKNARGSISDAVLQLVWDDTAEAIKTGLFDEREDRHLSRSVLSGRDTFADDITSLRVLERQGGGWRMIMDELPAAGAAQRR